MLELNRLEIMAQALKLVIAELEDKNSDFGAHVATLVLGNLEDEIALLTAHPEVAGVPVLNCGDCIEMFNINISFGLEPVPCGPCRADGIFITKGKM